MKIRNLPIDEAGTLAAFYNKEFANLPYCYRVTPEEFAVGITAQEDSDESYPMLSNDKLLIGIKDGHIVGFIHIAVWHKGEEADWRIGRHPLESILDERVGLILFLHYQRSHRPVGQALLETAEQYLIDQGLRQIRAFSYYGYRFHRWRHPFCLDRQGHVCSLLRLNGYRITRGSILLEWSNYDVTLPNSPDPFIEVKLLSQQSRGEKPNQEVQLIRDNQLIGQGMAMSGRYYCQDRSADDTFYIPWFFINGSPTGSTISKGEQGKGLGRYMMLRLLWEMRQQGYVHAALHVDMANARPQLFYMNLGFEVVDTSYQWFKILERDFPLSVYKYVGF